MVFTVQIHWRRGHSFSGSEKLSRRGSRLSLQPWGSAPRFVFTPLSTDWLRDRPQATGGHPFRPETDSGSRSCHQQRVGKAAIPNQPHILALCVNTITTLDKLDEPLAETDFTESVSSFRSADHDFAFVSTALSDSRSPPIVLNASDS